MLAIDGASELDDLLDSPRTSSEETAGGLEERGHADVVIVGESDQPVPRLLSQSDVQVAPVVHRSHWYPVANTADSGETSWLQHVHSNDMLSGEVFTRRGGDTGGDWGQHVARMPGSAAISAFGRYQHKRNLSPSTITHRRFRLRAFEEWLDKDILDVTAKDIDKWLDHHDLAPQTRYTYVAYLAAFYQWALKERLVRKDPTEDLIRPKLPKRVPRPIARDDLAHAVSESDPRMRCFLLLAAFAGARCMEIAALRVEDIHRDQNVLLLHGKGNKERLVPLHTDVLRSLTAFGLPRAGYVFRRRDGKPLKPSTISRYVGKYLRSVGVDATCHQGRHAYATALYQLSGGDLRMVQDMMGHASPSSSAIYAAWSPARAAEVVEQLELRQLLSD